MIKKSTIIVGACFLCGTAFSQAHVSSKMPVDSFPSLNVNIREYLKVFDDSSKEGVYRIAVCADVPNNAKPLKVAYKQETGHVFLILQKITPANDTISKVFGFYPRGGLQTLFFKKTKSYIKDNSRREHDVAISKELTASQFDTVLAQSIKLAERKYHMNRYNCYDYAIQIYNSVAGESPLPLKHIRFPFIFGRGGSPCCVYRDLEQLQKSGALMHAEISFGRLVAPRSTGRSYKGIGY
jgi:hypothetical protein